MNVLLFAPGLFVVLVLTHGFLYSLGYIFLCALVQVIQMKSINKIRLLNKYFIFNTVNIGISVFGNLSYCLYSSFI